MGILYVVQNEWIRDPETGKMPYKIGITKNSVKTRYYNLELIMPGGFECVLAYEFDEEKLYKELEKTIQGMLNFQRIKGEWFNCNEKILNSIDRICRNCNGKLITEKIEEELLKQAEKEKNNQTEEKEENNDNIYLLAEEKIKTIISTLTERYKLQFKKRQNGMLNAVYIKNNLDARLECNIYHPRGGTVELEFICRDSYRFPKIKTFIKRLHGVKINNHEFKAHKNVAKIYHSFNYKNPTILDTFPKLLDFALGKIKASKIFKDDSN